MLTVPQPIMPKLILPTWIQFPRIVIIWPKRGITYYLILPTLQLFSLIFEEEEKYIYVVEPEHLVHSTLKNH